MTIPSLSLKNKAAIVTGARRGMGKAIALAFAQAGADVAVCDSVIQHGELEAVAGEIKRLGRRSLAIQADVSNKSDVDNLVKKATEALGFIEILVNNAGIGGDSTFPDVPEDNWDKVMAVNLKGPYLCSQAVCKGMIEHKKGSIITISSMGGMRIPTRGRAYNVSKAGVNMLMTALAFEVAKYNVRANAIAPGRIDTDMSRKTVADPKVLDHEIAAVPMGRLGSVDDIIGPALFLASDASSYITGQTIIVDGGKSLD